MAKTLYDILGIKKNATADQIKKAYKKWTIKKVFWFGQSKQLKISIAQKSDWTIKTIRKSDNQK